MSGIFFNDEQSLNKLLILVIFEIFHSDKSGNEVIEEQLLKRLLKSVILFIAHPF